MDLDAKDLSKKDVYFLMTSVIAPRPIAWVSTRDRAGRANLAPFSYFMGVGSAPPMLAIAVGDRPDTGEPKDTAQNIRDTGVFAVNVVSAALAEAMVATAAPLPKGTSEFEAAGLAPRPCRRIAAPCVAAAPVVLECRLHDMLRPGGNPTHLIIGEIVHFFVDDAVRDEAGRVDPEQLALVGRLGGLGTYCRTAGALFELDRPR